MTDHTTIRPQAGSRPDTTIEADPEVPLIRITREFDAPPAKVFRAHTDPELFVQWIGPREITTEIVGWDCRDGGSWRYVSRGPEGAEHRFRGCFHTVDPAGLIVQTFMYEGMPDGIALERLELTELAGDRSRLVVTSLCDSFAARDAWMSSGMEYGVVESYERLDELLAPG